MSVSVGRLNLNFAEMFVKQLWNNFVIVYKTAG